MCRAAHIWPFLFRGALLTHVAVGYMCFCLPCPLYLFPYWWHVVGARHVGSRHLSLHSCDQHSCELFDIHDGTSVPPRVFVFCYPFKRASLVTQTLKNLPAMQKTQVRSLAWEDLLEKEMATHCSILAWKIPWTESLVSHSPWGLKELDTTKRLTLSLLHPFKH